VKVPCQHFRTRDRPRTGIAPFSPITSENGRFGRRLASTLVQHHVMHQVQHHGAPACTGLHFSKKCLLLLFFLWKTCYIFQKAGDQPWVRRQTGEALKPATDSQVPSQQVVKTTTTRIIPVDSTERKTPDLWEYLESLNGKDPSEWDRHMIYIYRQEPPPSVPIEKCVRHISMPDGSQVSLADQEAVEFALMQKYGGKVFRLIVKRGVERVTQGRVYVDAPARPITVQPDMSGQGSGTMGSVVQMTDASATAQVAGRAMDALTSQERQSAEIGFAAMRTAADVMQRFAKPNGGDPSADSLSAQVMQAIIARALNPPDPIDMLVKLMALTREVSGGGGAAGNPLVDKLLGAAVERFMNPAPAGAPVSASAELVRQLPQIGNTVAESLREFRLAREAEERIVRVQRGNVVTAPNPQVLPPTPAPTLAPINGADGAPSMEFVEKKIIEILRQPKLSAQQAADEAMSFLDTVDQNAIDQLAQLGEVGMVTLFQKRPVLAQATNNMPRLIEFIRAFLTMAAEDKAHAAAEAAAAAASAAPAPKPNLPN
jgi:hypothetical protein